MLFGGIFRQRFTWTIVNCTNAGKVCLDDLPVFQNLKSDAQASLALPDWKLSAFHSANIDNPGQLDTELKLIFAKTRIKDKGAAVLLPTMPHLKPFVCILF